MTHKNHGRHADDQADGAAEAAQSEPGASASHEPLSEDLQALRNQLAEAEARAAESLDGWQRALAEFQNYKKRVERDRDSDQAAMKADLIKKVLPVLDDLERALQNRAEDDAWSSGIELIRRKFEAILESEGVKRIECEGALFDPNFHEAVSQESVDGAEGGRVVGVTRSGYMLGDRVIRPAQVRVAA
ncbi:MAG: nucleotide exchange factor GrpE [Chloroflexota bacterium]